MKLISYRHGGRETWGAVQDGQVLDLAEASGLSTLADFVGSEAYARRDALLSQARPVLAYEQVELLPVIPRPEKIVCAVRNYMDHHQEVLAAGTPASVGWSRKPQRFMQAGDVCEVEIEAIGVLRNPIVAQA